MVGRLARYLRFVGCDTAYARGWSDDRVLEIARREDRIVLTRDRALARRTTRALLLSSPAISEQWRQVVASFPAIPRTPSFRRCTLCNGGLVPYAVEPGQPRPETVPWDRVAAGLPLFRCGACGHLYWEGSHTANVGRQLARWSEGSGP